MTLFSTVATDLRFQQVLIYIVWEAKRGEDLTNARLFSSIVSTLLPNIDVLIRVIVGYSGDNGSRSGKSQRQHAIGG